jgi:hypothetical protein
MSETLGHLLSKAELPDERVIRSWPCRSRFFAEAVAAPCMLIRLASLENRSISIRDFGLDVSGASDTGLKLAGDAIRQPLGLSRKPQTTTPQGDFLCVR